MAQGKEALRRQAGGRQGSGDNSYIGPIGYPDRTQGEAQGGRWFGNDLPVHPTSGGGSGFKEGFSPNNANPPLPPAGSNEGAGKPPTGSRR